MTDKVQKIKDFLTGMAGAACCDAKTKKTIETNILPFVNSLQEEPVSEDLGLYINELSKQFPEVSFAKLSRIAVRVAKWQKEQMMSKAIDFIIVDNNAISTEISTFPYVSLGTEGDTVKLIIINQD